MAGILRTCTVKICGKCAAAAMPAVGTEEHGKSIIKAFYNERKIKRKRK
ncbi:MAG: hypothetical protein ACI4LZ_05200 [Anaerovoracaceae bacterium]